MTTMVSPGKNAPRGSDTNGTDFFSPYFLSPVVTVRPDKCLPKIRRESCVFLATILSFCDLVIDGWCVVEQGLEATWMVLIELQLSGAQVPAAR